MAESGTERKETVLHQRDTVHYGVCIMRALISIEATRMTPSQGTDNP